jgi:hypothetical protein
MKTRIQRRRRKGDSNMIYSLWGTKYLRVHELWTQNELKGNNNTPSGIKSMPHSTEWYPATGGTASAQPPPQYTAHLQAKPPHPWMRYQPQYLQVISPCRDSSKKALIFSYFCC